MHLLSDCSHHNCEISIPGGLYTHMSCYVGLTLQSCVFQNTRTGLFKTPDPGMENRGYQNARDAHRLMPFWLNLDAQRLWYLRVQCRKQQLGIN
jgi:hypothetical protein